MNNDLKERIMSSMFRFKKFKVIFPQGMNLHMGELYVMQKINRNSFNPDDKVGMEDIQHSLYITKPAISQMLNTLEKKGFIRREINKSDRRRFIITLTTEGEQKLSCMLKYADDKLEEIIKRFGEEEMEQLIKMFNRFSEISESVMKETLIDDLKGETEND